ncbi:MULTISPECIES: hypothetical protein [unclassified Carboxylicivirga]|uniref:hypothetical protein n=1 Tax=Carboxylicivirga TaxID=1628153 RepID=UPI003D347D64
MRVLYNKFIKQTNAIQDSKTEHHVRTFKEFFYYHNTNNDCQSQYEIASLLTQIRTDIENINLSCKEIEGQINSPVYLNDDQISTLFCEFKSKLLKNIESVSLHRWLSLNIQESRKLTIHILESHIIDEFEKILIATHIWITFFFNDKIFKYSIVKDNLYELCPIKTAEYGYSFGNSLLRTGYFDGLSLYILDNQQTISYQTIFRLHPTDLSHLPYPARVIYREELIKRIDTQTKVNLSSDIHGMTINNLVDYYEYAQKSIGKLPLPLKFKLKDKEAKKKFNSISKYFIKNWKIVDCTILEFVKLTEVDSDENQVFNVTKFKKPYFFYFIDILSQECISKHGMISVIKDRFTFDGEPYEYENNSLSKMKERSINDNLPLKDKNIIDEQLKYMS